MIWPYLKDLSLEQITRLIELSSQNNQTYDRNKAYQDHRLVIKEYIHLNGGYKGVKDTPFEKIFKELGGTVYDTEK